MAVLTSVLLFLHLLGMAVLVGAFLVQQRVAPAGPLYVGWLHGGALQRVTGLGLVLAYRRRERIPGSLAPTLGGLTVLNVGVAVFWP